MTTNANLQSAPETVLSEVEAAIAFHNGDMRATIACLLADCADLRLNLSLAERAMSAGLTRGWRPRYDRET
ncbi:hypothetical protein [Rhizobium sp. SL86]|uniref:hypothetical protein n=1 Tax=Rhizobium sp. SL86 TaxID=2995148 RepID=UPI0022761CEA|nr:hypothetical protein [Rhizobium sp. SL86]MCY1667375.1 hypothetical protein [Rhizobium sp. SL86]